MKNKNIFGLLLVFMLLTPLSALRSFAQEANDVISGTVSDALGPIMQANVVEIDNANRIVSSTTTDMNGNFSFKIKNPKERQLKVYNLCKGKEKCRERKKKVTDGEVYDPQHDPYYKQGCNYIQPKFKRENLKIIMDDSKEGQENENENINDNENEEAQRYIKPREVMEIFSQIKELDCKLLGFDPKYSRPEWMIIQNLAVCPPQVRPSVSVDSSLRSQDDLTHQYNQILNCNNLLKDEKGKNAGQSTYQNKFENLQFNIATLMNNDLSFSRAHKKSGQPIKAIYARLKGKEGRVRGNLMGKRVDFSARSVISPDPNLQGSH